MPVTPSLFNNGDVAVIQWVGETGNGIGIQCNQWPDKTVQATGTGTVTLEGSPDGTNWFALNNTDGTPAAISLAAATNEADTIKENPVFIRAVNAAGTATVTITGNK